MSTKTVPALDKRDILAKRNTSPQPKHVHLHIDLDPESDVFQYRAVVNGEHTTLRRGDYITFRSRDSFSIQFESDSPFVPLEDRLIEAQSESGEWIISAQVRGDAELQSYPYTVRMTKFGQVYQDQPEQVRVVQGDPEVIVVQV